MRKTRRTMRVENRKINDLRKEIVLQSRSLGERSNEMDRSRGNGDSRNIGKYC